MPEGDTLAATAATLQRAIGGRRVIGVTGSHPALRPDAARMAGTEVTGVRSVGKHLIVEFGNGWALRTHLGMPGAWHVYRPGERWRRSPGQARVVVETEAWVAVCFAAPTVQLARAAAVSAAVAHLGPDLSGPDADLDAVIGRARAGDPEAPVGEVLLDQTVAAGIGNVIKSETLFLGGVHPAIPQSAVGDDALRRLYRRASSLLQANARGGTRVTTGSAGRGGELWVYGRAGRRCRRCPGRITAAELGDPPRITYWCPRCQPASDGGAPAPPVPDL